MKKTPLVSVVMNAFNGERFLVDALNSVYGQSYENWEIVFWDNASIDKTGSIAKSFGKRLRYFRAKKRTSLGEARREASVKLN